MRLGIVGANRHLHKRRLYAAQNGQCCHCQRKMTKPAKKLGTPGPRDPTFDHIVPRSKGGTDATDNVALACHECNHAKDSLMPEQFKRDTK